MANELGWKSRALNGCRMDIGGVCGRSRFGWPRYCFLVVTVPKVSAKSERDWFSGCGLTLLELFEGNAVPRGDRHDRGGVWFVFEQNGIGAV
jgi:hypothetical protein